MPSSPNYKRDYKQERLTAIKRKETSVGPKSKDAMRHKARRAVNARRKKVGQSQLKENQHVDHKKGVGAGNGAKNLRVRGAGANTSAGGKAGNRKGKAAGARKANRSK